MIRRPPESTRAYTPLPSTTLFRSSRTSHRHRASMTLSIRSAAPADLPLIAQFIRDLADYEKLAHAVRFDEATLGRSEEHTSELQSLMRISYAALCLKKKKNRRTF